MKGYLGKNPGHVDFRGVDRVVEILDHDKDLLCYACQMLTAKKKDMEAKGIMVRYDLKPVDFEEAYEAFPKVKGGGNISFVGRNLMKIKYKEAKDYLTIDDSFEPVSEPIESYISLPQGVNVEFIETDKQIFKLKGLIGSKFIGVDAEWRAQIHKWHEINGPAIFQISNSEQAFLIDVLKLNKNKKLDKTLQQIFQDKRSTIIGFGFTSDISMFSKYYPHMKFIDYVENFIEMNSMYKEVFPDFRDHGGSSLAAVCERMLEKNLCKNEQVSNWERRPLRQSQMHYAALDAWILPKLLEKMLKYEKQEDNDILLKMNCKTIQKDELSDQMQKLGIENKFGQKKA